MQWIIWINDIKQIEDFKLITKKMLFQFVN